MPHSDITQVRRNTRHGFTLLTAALLLVACGGGGGGDSTPTPPTNTAPNVTASAAQTVPRNTAVTLSAAASDSGGTAGLSFEWVQTAGTAVSLSDAMTSDATFTSPDVAADEVLMFEVTVTDAGGLSDTDTTDVTVLRNVAPVAAAGDDQNVEQTDTVTLSGGATDDDPIGELTFAWTQTAGPVVTIDRPDAAVASFVAPGVTGIASLTFRLTVTDAFGEVSVDEIVVQVFEDLNASSVSGKVEYQFVPFSNGALSYGQQEMRPVRGATVQVIDAGDGSTVLGQTVTNDTGDYVIATTVASNVFLRVRAELKRTGTPGWDVEVRDNTGQAATLALANRPLYVLDGTPFNTVVGPQTVDLQAMSGWGGASYTGTRAAAPFSVLDTIYSAIQLVIGADPNAVFAPLDAFWSVNNSPTVNAGGIDDGELGTSFYRGDLDSLFLLGEEDTDTEEFDIFVVAHEWGHYFEDNFSRSDSVGGSHSLSQRLDPRLAFGEGFGNAVSAMINEGDTYFDTQGAQQGSGFSFSLENNAASATNRGWFSERSVQVVLYDIFDSDADLFDDVSLGFGPIFDVLTNEQADGVPFTTIYPFIEALRARNPGAVTQIDALLAAQRIVGDNDGYGTNETESAGRPNVTLPIYTVITPDGTPQEVCSSNVFDPDEDGNKLGIRRFVRFTIAAAGTYNVAIVTNNPPATGQSDPDAFVFDGPNLVGGGNSGVADREDFTLTNFQPGEYAMEVYEFSYLRGSTPAITQPDSLTCFDITISN
ncbi:MAG: hypothetical protein AAF004_08820 [Pseudomonadota bacterium]